MKEQILKLRKEGKTYNQICKEVGCSKGTVSYYCGEEQKEKTVDRTRRRRKEISILIKVEIFQNRKRGNQEIGFNKTKTKRNNKTLLRDKTRDFQRERVNQKLGKAELNFNYKDVIKKFGEKTTCYLTGRPIDLKRPRTYSFDHVIPVSKGGENSLENLGLTCREANWAKSNMMIQELLCLCKEILEHNGYEIKKI
jgi:5-methylcytosine-specific restriction endonuclease McrA